MKKVHIAAISAATTAVALVAVPALSQQGGETVARYTIDAGTTSGMNMSTESRSASASTSPGEPKRATSRQVR